MSQPAFHSPSAESQKKTAPLTGWRVLVTRPDTPGTSLSERLKLLGAEVHTYPLIEIVPPRSWDSFDRTLSSAEQADWIIFTSRNGFEFCCSRLEELGKSHHLLNAAQIACVGRSTAEAVQKKGLTVNLVPEHHQSEGLLEALDREKIEGKRFWLIQAEEPRQTLRRGLLKRKAEVRISSVYRNQFPDRDFSPMLELLQASGVDWLILCSASAVENLFRIIPSGWDSDWKDSLNVACLGETTAAAAKNRGLHVTVQPVIQDFSHLLESLCEHAVSR